MIKRLSFESLAAPSVSRQDARLSARILSVREPSSGARITVTGSNGIAVDEPGERAACPGIGFSDAEASQTGPLPSRKVPRAFPSFFSCACVVLRVPNTLRSNAPPLRRPRQSISISIYALLVSARVLHLDSSRCNPLSMHAVMLLITVMLRSVVTYRIHRGRSCETLPPSLRAKQRISPLLLAQHEEAIRATFNPFWIDLTGFPSFWNQGIKGSTHPAKHIYAPALLRSPHPPAPSPLPPSTWLSTWRKQLMSLLTVRHPTKSPYTATYVVASIQRRNQKCPPSSMWN